MDEFVLYKLELGRIKFKVAVSDNYSNVVAAIRESCMNNRASQVTRQALEFSKVLLGKLKERFPQYGMNRELNCMANYLNSLKTHSRQV